MPDKKATRLWKLPALISWKLAGFCAPAPAVALVIVAAVWPIKRWFDRFR